MLAVRSLKAVLLALLAAGPASAQQFARFAEHTFFAGSPASDYYSYSRGSISAPSTVRLVNGRIPLETAAFKGNGNALELDWTSAVNGGWDVAVEAIRWRNAELHWQGDALSLWVYAPAAITAAELPRIALTDEQGGSTVAVPLASFTGALPGKTWRRLIVPFRQLRSASLRPFQSGRMNAVVFSQNGQDAKPHTLFVDEVRVDGSMAVESMPTTPSALAAEPFERHVDLSWQAADDPSTTEYVIYRSESGKPFHPVGTQRYGMHRFTDWIGTPQTAVAYKISARDSQMHESPQTAAVSTKTTSTMTDEELLTMVQRASFRYYWDGAEPNSGMALESQPGPDHLVAMGASGFGVMALVVAVDRGFITREEGLQRMLRITNFLDRADKYHGAWPHFLDGETGKTVPLFGIYDDGADLVETSFMMEGLLTARQYFQRDVPQEQQLRGAIDKLWRGVDWDWFRATPLKDALWWHWSPNYAFHIANRLEGWNEVMITYLLAIASPTHAAPASIYHTGYQREGKNSHGQYGIKATYFGIPLEQGYLPGSPGPLFFTQYSFMGYDPRGVRDTYTNYFRNNRNEALMMQAYAKANPMHFAGYGADSWGLTAIDGPGDSYHEYMPFREDDGTIAPTGAVSSYCYTPDQSTLAIRHWYRDLGRNLWSVYGFRDGFNESQNWYSSTNMGLNQAPQVVMIENGRTGLIWKTFMSAPEIRPMQKAIGLVPDHD